MLQLLEVAPEIAANLLSLNKIFSGIMPIVASTSLTYLLSVKKRLPPMPVSLLALISTLVVKMKLIEGSSLASSFMLIIAISISFIVVYLVYWLYQKEWTKIIISDFAGGNVKTALNLTIPSIIVFFAIFVALKVVLITLTLFHLPEFFGDMSISDSYLGGMLYSSLNSILWFFGIHGGNIFFRLCNN